MYIYIHIHKYIYLHIYLYLNKGVRSVGAPGGGGLLSAGITESRCWPYDLLCWGRPWASLRFCRTDALASTRASFWGSGGSGKRVASSPFGRWGVPGAHFVVFPNRRSRLDESFKMEVMGFLWGSPFCSLGMLDLCFCLWIKKK